MVERRSCRSNSLQTFDPRVAQIALIGQFREQQFRAKAPPRSAGARTGGPRRKARVPIVVNRALLPDSTKAHPLHQVQLPSAKFA
jgi:hypothetical protein